MAPRLLLPKGHATTFPPLVPPPIYLTENHEYHVIDGTCVEVRDKKARRTEVGHVAVGSRIIGCMRLSKRGFEMSRQVEAGRACAFV